MDWQRLAEEVIARRVELGYRTREQFVTEVGISRRVISDIENHRRDNYDKATIARLEDALRWKHGQIAAILRGELSGPPEIAADVDPLLVVANSKLSDEEKVRLYGYVLRRRARQQSDLAQEVAAILRDGGVSAAVDE